MITAENLTKTFCGVKALDNMNLKIDNGSVYGLVGSNGSGKSTFLRLVSGVYVPDSGRVCIDGEDVFDNVEKKAKISFLGDTPYFLPQSDLAEMARFYESMYPDFDREAYNYLLSVFPLDQKKSLSGFSKGMQRQAALILALSARPDYILLDEAFDGLDVVMRRVLANLISDGIEKYGSTAVISSHNLRELEDLCDNIGLLHQGKMLISGNVEELRGRIFKVQAAFKSVPEMSVFKQLNVIKSERSGSLLQMVIRGEEDEIMSFINKLSPVFAECVEPTLEEMFIYELEVTGYDVKNILS